ncbi:MAG: nucleotidyltransferase domain-containing protein [Candidatus Micrarchaeota archaeon]
MNFESFSGVRVLGWFLKHPTRRIHFKDLCRELGLGPLTVKTYCEEFVGRGWLREERSANLRIFYLDNESYVVKAMKRACILEMMHKERFDALADDTIISLALYGSHASGEYDEKSDLDVVVVGRREQVRFEHAEKLEKKLGRRIQITVFSLERWERNRNKDPFMLSVLKSHVLLKGAPL